MSVLCFDFVGIGTLAVAQVNALASLDCFPSPILLATMNYLEAFPSVCFLLMSAGTDFCCTQSKMTKLASPGCILE